MKKIIPGGIDYESGHLSFSEINRRFEKTEHGKKLSDSVRWGPMKTDKVSNAEWCRLLGADVNNFHHNRLTYGLTRAFLAKISHENLSGQDLEVILLTAITHDWAEAVLGDTPYDKKGLSNEEQERVILSDMLYEYLPEDVGSQNSRVPEVLATLYDRNAKLWKLFNIVEKLGYIRTGLNAFDRRHHYQGEQSERLAFMGKKVVANHVDTMFANAEQYPVLLDYLRLRMPLFERIMSESKFEDFQKYAPGHEEQCQRGLVAVQQSFAKLKAK
jgi:hypothetical protein